jgi:tetratricopeptide (TPR) repeat protein
LITSAACIIEESKRVSVLSAIEALALAASPGVSNAERAYTSMLLGDYHAWSEPPDREKAEGYYKDALALDVEDSVVAAARDYNRLGNLALEDDRKAGAQEYFGKAANAAKNFPEGTNPLFKGQYDHDFAAALYEDGNFDEALRQFSTSSESFRNAYGDDSIEFGIAENNVGRMLLELDRVEESAARISTAVRVETAARGPQFNGLAMALNTHALTLRATGKATEAAAQFTKALEVAQANDSGVAAQILVHMAEDDLLANDIPAAKKRLDMAKSVFERKDAAAGWRYALYQSAMAELLLRECQLVEARTYLERSGTVLNRRWPNGNVFTRNAAARQQSLEKNSGCAGDTTKA